MKGSVARTGVDSDNLPRAVVVAANLHASGAGFVQCEGWNHLAPPTESAPRLERRVVLLPIAKPTERISLMMKLTGTPGRACRSLVSNSRTSAVGLKVVGFIRRAYL